MNNISRFITKTISRNERKQKGIYFTPPLIVDNLVRRLVLKRHLTTFLFLVLLNMLKENHNHTCSK